MDYVPEQSAVQTETIEVGQPMTPACTLISCAGQGMCAAVAVIKMPLSGRDKSGITCH